MSGSASGSYIVILEPAAEGGFEISCPALPGCCTQGETREEALEMIHDAIVAYIESMKKHGEAPATGEMLDVEVNSSGEIVTVEVSPK